MKDFEKVAYDAGYNGSMPLSQLLNGCDPKKIPQITKAYAKGIIAKKKELKNEVQR